MQLRNLTFLLLGIVPVLLARPSSAAEETVDVKVHVTDEEGHRVTGLSRDDFVLAVDGDPVAITDFQAVRNGTPQTPLHLILFVDDLHLSTSARKSALRFLRPWLRDRRLAGGEVMVVSSGHSLDVHQPFTGDRRLVASVLAELETRASPVGVRPGEILASLERDRELLVLIDPPGERGTARHCDWTRYDRLRLALHRLAEVVETVGALPGTKAILLASDGLAMRPCDNRSAPDPTRAVLMEMHRFDMTRDFRRLVARANTNGVTFYTLDMAGSRASPIDAASYAEEEHPSSQQDSLAFLAHGTGGVSLLEIYGTTPGLEQMAEDFSSYYSVGTHWVRPPGRRGELEVRLAGKESAKLRVSHRMAYRDKPRKEKMTDGIRAVLLYGYQSDPLYGHRDDPLDLRMEFGRERMEEDGSLLVPWTVRIPVASLSRSPQDGRYRGRFRLWVGGQDCEGELSPVTDVWIPVDIPAGDLESPEERHTQLEHEWKVMFRRPGRHVVAIGVLDEIGGAWSLFKRELSVGMGPAHPRETELPADLSCAL